MKLKNVTLLLLLFMTSMSCMITAKACVPVPRPVPRPMRNVIYLTVDVTEGGKTIPSSGTYHLGIDDFSFEMMAIPDSGYRLDYWLLNGNRYYGNTAYLILWQSATYMAGVFTSTITAYFAKEASPTASDDLPVVCKLQVLIVESLPQTVSDVNGDGVINIIDISAVSSFYGSHNTNVAWQTMYRYDLNSDGKIDIVDITMVAANFRKQTVGI